MTDLPVDGMTEAPPFTYCGVDMFLPFIIKERRSEIKRHGILFTCLNSKTIHIEVANFRDTNSFILALRRFLACRGNVRFMRFDNGSNFVGTAKELGQALKEIDQQVKLFLETHGADWIVWERNPLVASNMGGVWERHIMADAEAVVNSRPLTVETISDVTSSLSLSPFNLLTMKSIVVMPPPGRFESPDLYTRKRWRQVQHIVNEFWSI